MTNSELLKAVDLVRVVKSSFARNQIRLFTVGRQRRFVAYMVSDELDLVYDLNFGDKGAVNAFIYMFDQRIKPAVDGVRVGLYDDLSIEPLLPLSRLCWRDQRKQNPSDDEVTAFLGGFLESLSQQSDYIKIRFNACDLNEPFDSVDVLQGGATGLKR